LTSVLLHKTPNAKGSQIFTTGLDKGSWFAKIVIGMEKVIISLNIGGGDDGG